MAEVTQPSILITDCTTLSNNDIDSITPYRICLVGDIQEDQEILKAAMKFPYPLVKSNDGLEYAADTEFLTYFVLSDFDTKIYEELLKHNVRLLGKPAFMEMSSEGVITYKSRPIFCLIMKNCTLVFTGFRKKTEVSKLLKHINYMGGSVKNAINDKATHLLAHSSSGEKYQYAVTFNVPVMSEDWVYAAWAHRDEFNVKAESEALMVRYKLKLFHNLKLVFIGFSEEDKSQMEDLVLKNGGFITALDDISITHVILDDQNISEKPSNIPEKVTVVKAEWFWASIQMDACVNERSYLYASSSAISANAMLSPRPRLFSPGTPGSRSRRRKRLRETVQQLAENDSPSGIGGVPPSKRRSSVGDLAFLSGDGSLLEDSLPIAGSPIPEKSILGPPTIDLKLLSPRHRVFHELVQTECNYVNVFNIIEKVIKQPLEDPNQPGGPMLDPQELRYIFSNVGPIHEVHTKLRNELLYMFHNWSDDMSIGKTILNYTSDFERVYPTFMNYHENVKELFDRIKMERPRFHAFLKIAQSKPECNKQDINSLFIKPVQRLPSFNLLISDIIKHTDRSSPDYLPLVEASDRIKCTLNMINDNIRKTEAKKKLFEIHNDIENCPPNLVASHRTYVSKLDVTELSDSCSGRGDSLSLFLFNDVVEICKRKGKFNSIKSPSRVALNHNIRIKQYKHLEMMSLAHIKRVVDIRETDDCRNVFAMIVRTNQELKERLYTFTISPSNEESSKSTFLRSLCCNMANVVCRSDVENFLVSMDPHHLDIDTSDVSITNALNKAIRFAARTGRKVSRAFSFNKSPSKLKRAVSTVMSPFANSSHFSLRGATSVNNLADLSLAATPPCGRTLMPAPMTTPTPKRRFPIKRL